MHSTLEDVKSRVTSGALLYPVYRMLLINDAWLRSTVRNAYSISGANNTHTRYQAAEAAV